MEDNKPLATEIIQEATKRATRYKIAFFVTLGLLVCSVVALVLTRGTV